MRPRTFTEFFHSYSQRGVPISGIFKQSKVLVVTKTNLVERMEPVTKFEDMEDWEIKLRGSIVGFFGSKNSDTTDADSFYGSYIIRQTRRGKMDYVKSAQAHKDIFFSLTEKLIKNRDRNIKKNRKG